MRFWRVGEPKFFPPLLAFALSGRELLGATFHRALPCAMSFLPRWGVKKFAATYDQPTPFVK
ncbi:MAG: hypothetical protein LBQ66_03015 [Planctomycetaceae bacterium]|nr:hypothetical protein [Planctomycetaceae bacterium]